MKRFMAVVLYLTVCMAPINAQTIYLQSGTSYTIRDFNQALGTAFQTERSSNPGYFTVLGTATFTGADNTHHVNGYVQHIADAANQPATFPVGSGTMLVGVTIGGNIPASSRLALAWINGDPGTTADPTSSNTFHPITNTGTGIQSVSSRGQWDWVDLSANNNGITATVSLPDLTGATVAAANLRLVGWDGNNWVNLGTAGASGLTAGSTLSGVLPPPGISIQALGIGTLSGALPVVFGSISATLNNNRMTVQWNTLSESGCSHYLVQWSADGSNFTTLDTVKSQAPGGNTDQQLNYTVRYDANILQTAALPVPVAALFTVLILGPVLFKRKEQRMKTAIFFTAVAFFISCRKEHTAPIPANKTETVFCV